jgi:calcineurin-like phosphoesterase family protein
MRTWFTSDWHIGHTNMTRAGKDLCGRPFEDVAHMNQTLLWNANAVVPSTDRLVMLGDNIMGRWEEGLEVVKQLQMAEVVFLPGNHDRWSRVHNKLARREAAREELENAREGFIVLMDGDPIFELQDDKPVLVGSDGPSEYPFCVLSDEWEGHVLNGAIFSHYPAEGESFEGRGDRYVELRPDGSRPQICGHVHGAWAERGNAFNAGVDVRDFKPVPEEEIVKWMESLNV